MGTPPSIQHVIALTVALADPGEQARYLATDDKGRKVQVGFASPKEAAASGKPFMIPVASDVVAFDADDAASARHAERMAQEMASDGIRSLLVASGRESGLHTFAIVPDDEARGYYCHQARRGGIDVRRWIRSPGSPHPAGYPVEFLNPVCPTEAVEILTRPDGRPPPLTVRNPEPRLAKRGYSLLRNGDRTNHYKSRSELIAGIATYAVRAGWTYEHFWSAMSNPDNIGGEGFRDRPARQREKWLRTTWDKAVGWVGGQRPITTREDAVGLILDIRAAANAHPWQGKAGASDSLVLHAHLTHAETFSSVAGYVFSVRDCADAAGVSVNTVRAAHSRLEAAGWLTPVWTGTGTAGSRWRLLLPDWATVPETLTPSFTRALSGASDAYQPGALSRHTPRVLAALADRTLTQAELCDKTGLSPSTVWRVLRDARDARMVVEDAGNRWHVIRDDAETLQRVACLAGTDGTISNRHDRHIQERVEQQLRFDGYTPKPVAFEDPDPETVTPPGDDGDMDLADQVQAATNSGDLVP